MVPTCVQEVIGHIVQMGAKVTGFKVGDRVGFGPQRDSCRECEYCKAGDEQYCEKIQVIRPLAPDTVLLL